MFFGLRVRAQSSGATRTSGQGRMLLPGSTNFLLLWGTFHFFRYSPRRRPTHMIWNSTSMTSHWLKVGTSQSQDLYHLCHQSFTHHFEITIADRNLVTFALITKSHNKIGETFGLRMMHNDPKILLTYYECLFSLSVTHNALLKLI